MEGGPGDHTLTDMDGFTVCKKEEDDEQVAQRLGINGVMANGAPSKDLQLLKKWGYYYCNQTSEGDLVPDTSLVVGEVNPIQAGVSKGLRKGKKQILADCGDFCTDGLSRRLHESTPTHRRLQGSLKNLVIIFKFKDHASRTLPSRNDIDELILIFEPI